MLLSENFLSKEIMDIWNGTLQVNLEDQLNSYVSTYCSSKLCLIRF